MSQVAKIKFTDYDTSISKALDLIDAENRSIIIKPNLTNSDKPPVTIQERQTLGLGSKQEKQC